MTDLTNVIDSTERASVIAHMLLRLAPEPAPEPWATTHAEPILAELLYAASPQGTGRGIDWVFDLLTAGQDLTAAATGAGARVDARWLRRWEGLDDRQRHVIAVTMRRAISPWRQTAHLQAS
ncbi:hypothetical protein CKJ63_07490 [Mycobacterium avium]|uniref:hypothetical protein n=1 Tax=Mycobacterium avium TaxID=1764 RepID=UPI000A067548|nr:hypothetical protein [Mycobacterium avium]PBA42278.1 hypothetical protein CKJ63_07490 [Mycobacterium avium]PBA86010.1 hypothetical protein CKJ72_00075 [Mycobacterium avium]